MSDPTQKEYLPDSPYPGIEPFGYAGRNVFFAREGEAQTLIRLIVMYRGVLLYADSGTGKSSLINAGLIPLAIGEGFQPQRIRVQPRRGEEIIVERLSEEVDGESSVLPSLFVLDAKQERTVLSTEKFLETLSQRATPVHPLLIFDQFEEWVTLFEGSSTRQETGEVRASQDGIRDAIVSLINDSRLPVKVLMALREDYLARLTPFFQRCPTLPDQYMRLTALQGDQIYQVIRGPFEKHPGRYQPEVSTDLARKIQAEFEGRSGGTDIRLTEVQIVCRSLFDSGKQGLELDRFFTVEGGVQGILERHLERALESLEIEQRQPAVGLLSRMVTSAGTRNVISRDDLLSRVQHEDGISRELLSKTLDNLEQKTKLVRRERRREVYYYEIVSEFLIHRIRNKAEEQQRLIALSKLEAAQRTAEEQRRRARRLQWLSATLVVVSMLALGAAGAAVWGWIAVAAERDRATARELAAASISNLHTDPERSVLLALQAVSMSYSKDKAVTVEAEDALHQALQASRVQLTLPTSSEEIFDLAFSPDGTSLVAATMGGSTRVWEATSGNPLSTFSPAEEVVLGFGFNPSGRHFVTASQNGTAKVWDAASETLMIRLAEPDNWLFGAAFSRDGTRLATLGMDKTAKVWDARSGSLLHTLSGHKGEVRSIVFSQDGTRIATASADMTAKVWDTASGSLLHTLAGHVDGITSIAFSPEGTQIATASLDRTAQVWDVASGQPLFSVPNHTNTVFRVAFGRDGQLATASADGTAKLWDTSSGQELFTLFGHTNPVNSVAFSPDGKRLATASWDKTVKVWDVSLIGIDFYTVAFSPDGARFATASRAGTAKVWDTASGSVLHRLPGHEGEVRSIVFSQDGTRIATASADMTAKVWDTASGSLLHTLAGHKAEVLGVAFHPNGTWLATASRDGTAKVWHASSEELKLLFTLPNHNNWVYSVAFSPDKRHLATASGDGKVRIWEVARPDREPRMLSGHNKQVFHIIFNPDGTRLATASLDNTAKVWDVVTGDDLLYTLYGHTNGVGDIAFSRDGTRLATAGMDKTAKVWDARSGEHLLTLNHTAGVNSLAFSWDGKSLMTAAQDNRIHVYPLDIKDLMELAHTRVKRSQRSLTPEECKKYLHMEQCPPSP